MVRIGFIGAGRVNFGGGVGPWDHASRLEQISDVEIAAIADVNISLAEEVLSKRKRGACPAKYANCKVYENAFEMIERERLDGVFIGLPPFCHGSPVKGLDIELACVKAGIHTFIEKPLSVIPPSHFNEYARTLIAEQSKTKAVVSVGYMFRYHPAVDKMKEFLMDLWSNGKQIMSVNARYNCAYSSTGKPHWWNKRTSGGPIIEQATHFCDLARYLAGEPIPETVSAIAVDASEPAGKLSDIPDEVHHDQIEEHLHIPRITSAHWKFQRNGIGSLMHGVALHGKEYEATFDVWADGLRMSLVEPYRPTCKLRVRTGDAESEQVFTFENADPYLEEDKAFIEAIKTGNHALVKCPYSDAAKTYNFTWAIRQASELNDS
eukprot:m.310323 g.310323  ORF g.310323 m.310323 type:complete len:378 (+) comp50902_c0_seq1:42-1175(+)